MIIGPPKCTSSRYRVCRDPQPVRLYLTENCRGRCRWKAPLLSRIPFFCERHRSSLCGFPSYPAHDVRIGGVPSLFAHKTRRTAEGTLPNDGRTDGEGGR